MKTCDILIVGASTTGGWFAYQMAKRGFKVTVLEKQEKENVSREYDIFHMGKPDMEKFDLEIPEKDSPVHGFQFPGSPARSPYGNYPKPQESGGTIGMHKHEFILRMNERAEEAGAEVRSSPYYINGKLDVTNLTNFSDANQDAFPVPSLLLIDFSNASARGYQQLTFTIPGKNSGTGAADKAMTLMDCWNGAEDFGFKNN